ncbi:hypothetical protein GEMRC1_010642 [Eukaryota sp. GEM-RC1]
MVGGSSRIPKLVELMEKRFPNKLRSTVQADHAIAMGAAVAHLHVLHDVVPHDLGKAIVAKNRRDPDVMSVIIPRFTNVPTSNTRPYKTVHDNQTYVSIRVYEGESDVAENNHLLGSFRLSNLPRLPAGQAKYDVTFTIDFNGILKVTAVDCSSTNNVNAISINSYKGRLSFEDKVTQRVEISRMLKRI